MAGDAFSYVDGGQVVAWRAQIWKDSATLFQTIRGRVFSMLPNDVALRDYRIFIFFSALALASATIYECGILFRACPDKLQLPWAAAFACSIASVFPSSRLHRNGFRTRSGLALACYIFISLLFPPDFGLRPFGIIFSFIVLMHLVAVYLDILHYKRISSRPIDLISY